MVHRYLILRMTYNLNYDRAWVTLSSLFQYFPIGKYYTAKVQMMLLSDRGTYLSIFSISNIKLFH